MLRGLSAILRLGLASRRAFFPATDPPPSDSNRPRFAQVGNPALRQLYQGDAEPYTAPIEEIVIPLAERKYIQTLMEIDCRWPIGDPQETDFHFCGKRKVNGLPYCEAHARRAFQPPQPRRRDRDFTGPTTWPSRQDVESNAEQSAEPEAAEPVTV